MSDWQIQMGDSDLEGWLQEQGLAAQASAIIEASGAETVSDLRLLGHQEVDALCKEAQLKLVQATKLRRALLPLEAQEQEEQLERETAASESPPPSEAVAICIDRSGSMGAEFVEVGSVARPAGVRQIQTRSRMDAVKQMFYAYRDRTESLDATIALGLVQFDDHVDALLECTPELDRFEEMVDEMKPRGTTAIYDAIVQAAQMLPAEVPAKRVLCLTDGQCNRGAPVEAALEAVNAVDAVVDALLVGDQCDDDLRRLVEATGGRCFQIASIGDGFELLESEEAVSLAARGERNAPRVLGRAAGFVTAARQLVAAPAAAPAVKTLSEIAAASGERRSGLQLRVGKELKQVQNDDSKVWLSDGEGVHIFPSDDLTFWRVLLEGPSDSPFAGGVFVVNVRIPDTYPMAAPEIKFETPVYHCNVSETGGMCLFQGELDGPLRSWSPAQTLPQALEAVRRLLGAPKVSAALRSWIAELTRAEGKELLQGELAASGIDTRYSDEAKKQTRLHASKSVAEWRQEWGC